MPVIVFSSIKLISNTILFSCNDDLQKLSPNPKFRIIRTLCVLYNHSSCFYLIKLHLTNASINAHVLKCARECRILMFFLFSLLINVIIFFLAHADLSFCVKQRLTHTLNILILSSAFSYLTSFSHILMFIYLLLFYLFSIPMHAIIYLQLMQHCVILKNFHIFCL